MSETMEGSKYYYEVTIEDEVGDYDENGHDEIFTTYLIVEATSKEEAEKKAEAFARSRAMEGYSWDYEEVESEDIDDYYEIVEL